VYWFTEVTYGYRPGDITVPAFAIHLQPMRENIGSAFKKKKILFFPGPICMGLTLDFEVGFSCVNYEGPCCECGSQGPFHVPL